MFDRKSMEGILEKIKDRNGKKIFLQVPEGLKMGVQDLADFLTGEGIDVFISIEPCFGACDLRINEAEAMGCDLVVHVGHSDFGVESKIQVIYHEYGIEIDPVPLLEHHLASLGGYKRIGLVTTIQFVSALGKVRDFLEKNGFAAMTGKSSKGIEGQILGCDHSAGLSVKDEVDCFLFVGSGRFHPLGLQEKTEKPVFFLDVEKSQLTNFSRERERMETLSIMRVQKAKGLDNFGIIVSSKPGQMKTKMAEEIKERLKGMGKKVYVLVADQITPEKLMGLKIDVLVNTACPRIREDHDLFRKTILNPEDLERMDSV
ncbi:MAG: diphthamide biosynthesis enzyme Dph2 [Candidatus Aenigmarchaeota archaeon]|nr:diphthamide biosynthesis enzyme Dph2 [Candidatus Aenigmarchaeota archaeon]